MTLRTREADTTPEALETRLSKNIQISLAFPADP
jgi:hypothetical protein